MITEFSFSAEATKFVWAIFPNQQSSKENCIHDLLSDFSRTFGQGTADIFAGLTNLLKYNVLSFLVYPIIYVFNRDKVK